MQDDPRRQGDARGKIEPLKDLQVAHAIELGTPVAVLRRTGILVGEHVARIAHQGQGDVGVFADQVQLLMAALATLPPDRAHGTQELIGAHGHCSPTLLAGVLTAQP